MTTPYHVLIVDDDAGVRFTLERTLRKEGYALAVAATGQEALRRLDEKSCDLILLDLELGDTSGLQILHAARRRDPEVVVIILTGQGSLETAVEALRLGAFDYLFKPTVPDMIRQRVAAGLRVRQRTRQRQQILKQIDVLRQALNQLETEEAAPAFARESGRFIHSGPLVVDRQHRAATMHGQLLDLTTTEFDLLVCLVEQAPEPLPAPRLLTCAMGYEADPVEARETIKWHIHHLRRKIEPDPGNPQFIKTVRYKGYFWSAG